jgi:hypothetical protein
VVNVSSDKVLKIVLDDEDKEDLKDLVVYTLSKISFIVDKHMGALGKTNVNLWRAFSDELLMIYVGDLLRIHIEVLQEFVKTFSKFSEVVEGK